MATSIDVSKLKGLLPPPKKKVSIAKMNRVIAKRGAKHHIFSKRS